MLPFTKRPGRGDESGDLDVVTKDHLASAETIGPKPGAVATRVTPAVTLNARPKFTSVSDDEMTNIIPSKAIGDALESARSSPRPAAGMPPASPSSGRTAQRAAPSSRGSSTSAGRSGKFAAVDDEEEDGRTVVRGAPKIVKRATNAPNSKMGVATSPTTISPAAVIKATLESARAGQNMKKTGDHLMAPPPKDLLEDLSDLLPHPADGVGAENTKILHTTGSGGVVALGGSSGAFAAVGGSQGAQALPVQSMSGSIPPGSARPMSAPPPAMVGQTTNASGGYPAQQSGGYAAQQSGGYPAQQSGGYPAQQNPGYPPFNGPAPSGSVSVPGVSMPAHFMVPQAPYSDGRMDPPATAVTTRTRSAGRPAASWAMALMSFGLFVGVGAFAVMRGNADGLVETSASFVDPARAGGGARAAAGGPVAPVVATPVTEAPPLVAAPVVAPTTGPVVAAPVVGPAVAVAPVVAAPAPSPAVAVVAAPPVAAPAPPVAVAAAPTARPVPHAAPRVHAPAPAAAPEPVAVAPPTKPAGRVKLAPGGAKPAGETGVEEEQKKALKALQESQLESTF